MALVVKNKDTNENVITVEEWLATANNPDYTEAWSVGSKVTDGTCILNFDHMWNAYMAAVNGVMVEEPVI
jgi:hypothetical protein